MSRRNSSVVIIDKLKAIRKYMNARWKVMRRFFPAVGIDNKLKQKRETFNFILHFCKTISECDHLWCPQTCATFRAVSQVRHNTTACLVDGSTHSPLFWLHLMIRYVCSRVPSVSLRRRSQISQIWDARWMVQDDETKRRVYPPSWVRQHAASHCSVWGTLLHVRTT